MSLSKLSERLRERLETAAEGECIDVVLELRHLPPPQTGSREARIAEARTAFQFEVDPVAAAIRSASGEVLGHAWVNQTILARIAVRHLAALAELSQVILLDLPRTLTLGSGAAAFRA